MLPSLFPLSILLGTSVIIVLALTLLNTKLTSLDFKSCDSLFLCLQMFSGQHILNLSTVFLSPFLRLLSLFFWSLKLEIWNSSLNAPFSSLYKSLLSTCLLRLCLNSCFHQCHLMAVLPREPLSAVPVLSSPYI